MNDLRNTILSEGRLLQLKYPTTVVELVFFQFILRKIHTEGKAFLL
jgi:hypothetical protein